MALPAVRAVSVMERLPPFLAPLLLLAALSTVFLFGHPDRDRFYRAGNHDKTTAKQLAVAENLSLDSNLLGFLHRSLNDDGEPVYHPYNRFPIGGYVLTRIATAPFPDSLSETLYVSRLLMLSFFAAAALLAYAALARIVDDRWVASTATLLSFSSFYSLYYNDMVAPEGAMSLFGAFLVFHGMTVFERDGRFAQLAVKTCVALLLGWHVYALLAVYVALGLWRARNDPRPPGAARRNLRALALVSPLLRSRYAALAALSLVFGALVLSFGLVNEYFALRGEGGPSPSVRSILGRTGLDANFGAEYADRLAWPAFLERQLLRVVHMSTPFAFSGVSEWPRRVGAAGVVLACAAALVPGGRLRGGILWIPLVSFGFFWALPMRHHTAFHDYESVYYIGVPLAFFSLVSLAIRSLTNDRVVFVLAILALAVFGFSSFRMSHVGNDAEASRFQEEMFADIEAIRDEVAPGRSVFLPVPKKTEGIGPAADGVRHGFFYWLSGRIAVFNDDPEKCRLADFVVSPRRGARTLTPDNRRLFLYARTEAPEFCREGRPGPSDPFFEP